MISPKKFITPEEYLALEQESRDKHEYWNGESYMMAGASINHNQIVNNTFKSLDRRLERRPCRVFTSDVRLHIEKGNAYVYPDVMVVCGKIEIDTRQKDTVMNPTLIVEIWSDSTQGDDQEKKFKWYRQIPSLQDYVMIDQSQPYVEYYRREGRFWVLETIEGIDAVLKLNSLELEIPLTEIYEKVELVNTNA
ncbi:MAG TPA: Uma2 family endonuclease [Anaerolineae bacterium]|nr:Uma2 family endonuclease [Anaerolineae bacterium]